MLKKYKIVQRQKVNSYIEIGTINRDFINGLSEYSWHVVFHFTELFKLNHHHPTYII